MLYSFSPTIKPTHASTPHTFSNTELYEGCQILRLFKETTAKVKNGGNTPQFTMCLHGVVLN
jgi:hypothetical protein